MGLADRGLDPGPEKMFLIVNEKVLGGLKRSSQHRG
jgi:hypothetical protein